VVVWPAFRLVVQAFPFVSFQGGNSNFQHTRCTFE
jgi:hypothetical protein